MPKASQQPKANGKNLAPQDFFYYLCEIIIQTMSENRPYDIFISYRRQGGAEYVRPLKAELELRGYNVFLDYDELKDGVFDRRIMDAIEQAPIFVFMLSAHSLDRCVNDDDWVRKEIEFAVSKKRHFVPVNPNKEFDGFPDNVPEQVKQSLGQHQFSHIDFEQLFKASVTEMVANRIQPVLSRRTSEKTQSGKGALIRIDTDLDCRILRFGKEVGTAVSGELSEIRLPKGKHKLSFVGLECEEDCTELLLDVDDLDYEDYVEIRLLDKYNARRAREAAARKAREEAERKAREEAKRRAREEAKRRAREEAERKAQNKKYNIGDYYNDGVREGVVFEVSADGRHGRIVSMKQSSEELQWSSDETERQFLIGADSKTDGAYNMAKVMARPDWQSKYPAFKWCADLGEGWYLPSIEELKTFTLNDAVHDAVNRTLIARGGTKLYDRGERRGYWSSTESSKTYSFNIYACLVGMSSGSNSYYKFGYYYVRAVATFGDIRVFVEMERKAREEAARKAREEAERRAREEAARKASEEAARKAREEAERRRRRRLGIYGVGDYYNDGVREGVVFEVSADGRHGKIVSMKQSAKELLWAINERKFGLFKSEAERLIGADSETDGAANMAKIRTISGWEAKYPAFKWCADLGEGWYLPAIDELKTFTFNDAVYDAVNRTLIARGGTKLYDKGEWNWYWSSTERDYKFVGGEFCAWIVTMDDGHTSNFGKSYNGSVRAVSAFGDSSNVVSVATTSAPYRVGDFYNENGKQGVVYEVSADGRHGKIVSMKQSTGKLQWATYERKFGLFKSETERLIGADSTTDGAANMAKVMAISGWRNKYPAFRWCADLGEGWYLYCCHLLRV